MAESLSANKFAQSLITLAANAFLEVAQGDPELRAIETTAKAFNFKEEQPCQVGNCDLFNFYPLHPPGKSPNASAAVRLALGTQGEDNYYYLGSKMKSTAGMCIVPNPERFIFAETVLQDSRAQRKRECAHISTPVTSTPWVQQQSSGPASARVVVKKVGKNKWTVEGTATGDNGPPDSPSLLGEAMLETELTIPDSRSGTSMVKMDVTVQTLSGICDLRASVGFVTGAGGSNSPTGVLSESSPRTLNYSLSESGASLVASLGFQIIAYPLRTTAGSCNANGTIELILPEE